jgi:alkanesulfonate monooxygenase SsuD/methylene tetrahydromethanopterin reductase-like flavin-dependent oxidoreductase (luciferase family)
LPLSILNFTSTPAEALGLVRLCDQILAYRRFWVGESHNDCYVADPLTFSAVAAGVTQRIRVGTGAVSLTFRHPELIAETALMAELLFPDRIDLGVTRAASTSPEICARLMDAVDGSKVLADYESRLWYLRNILTRDPRCPTKILTSQVARGPAMYLMVTSAARARHAGHLGVGVVVSLQHGTTLGQAREALREYRASFRPSALFGAPYAIVVTGGFVSDDTKSLRALRQSVRQSMMVSKTMGHPLAQGTIISTPEDAATRIRRQARVVGADEVMFVAIAQPCAPCYIALARGWEATEPVSAQSAPAAVPRTATG